MIDVQVLKELLINPRNGSKNHFIADCPFCGKPKHFYINKGISTKGVENGWDCKKCNEEGNIITLLSRLGKLHLLDGRQVDLHAKFDSLLLLNAEEKQKEIDVTLRNIRMPVGFTTLDYESEHEIAEYFRDRKFTEIDFQLYGVGYNRFKTSKYYEYAMLSIYQNQDLKGFITRYSIDKKNKKRFNEDKIRYLNSKNDFSKMLFGLDELNEKTNTVILTEGVFDKVGVTTELGLHYVDELKCLSTFGKKISDEQLFLLKKAGVENLIFMYDGRDAVNDMKKIVASVKNEFNSVLISYTGELDPAESDKTQILNYLSNSKNLLSFWFDKVNVMKLK